MRRTRAAPRPGPLAGPRPWRHRLRRHRAPLPLDASRPWPRLRTSRRARPRDARVPHLRPCRRGWAVAALPEPLFPPHLRVQAPGAGRAGSHPQPSRARPSGPRT